MAGGKGPVGGLDHILNIVDGQMVAVMLLALIPNLLIILWAMARLSRDVRLLRGKVAMLENDIDLLDQSLSLLSTEVQGLRGESRRKNNGTPPPVALS